MSLTLSINEELIPIVFTHGYAITSRISDHVYLQPNIENQPSTTIYSEEFLTTNVVEELHSAESHPTNCSLYNLPKYLLEEEKLAVVDLIHYMNQVFKMQNTITKEPSNFKYAEIILDDGVNKQVIRIPNHNYVEQQTSYPFPTFITQGGGIARETRDGYVFVQAPPNSTLTVGDFVPEEWGLIPTEWPIQS